MKNRRGASIFVGAFGLALIVISTLTLIAAPSAIEDTVRYAALAMCGFFLIASAALIRFIAVVFKFEDTPEKARQWVEKNYNQVEGGLKKYLFGIAGNFMTEVFKK